MTRDEALRILGLDEGANDADIKAAYKEMAQILHPDRFQDNKKLVDRATEQFKQVNEARDYLLTGKGSYSRGAGRASSSGSSGGRGSSGGSRTTTTSRGGYADRATALRARLAGIATARTQLVAQRDHEIDSRRVGIFLLVGGIIAFVVGRVVRPLMALGPTAAVWGIIQIFTSQAHIGVINNHLETLEKERLTTEKELEGL
jgi:hypothetical protein